MNGVPDYGLEFLLAFDGRIHQLEEGYRIKFEIRRTKAGEARPHGLSYSFTLHAPDGTRLIGFDNAHSVRLWGRDLSGSKPRTITGIGLRPIQAGRISSRMRKR